METDVRMDAHTHTHNIHTGTQTKLEEKQEVQTQNERTDGSTKSATHKTCTHHLTHTEMWIQKTLFQSSCRTA